MNAWKNPEIKKILETAILTENILTEELLGKTFFLTGGCGLIGRMLVQGLSAINAKEKLDMKLVLLVRDKNRAQEMFSDNSNYITLEFVEQDLSQRISYGGTVDYIIHGASITQSKSMVEHPLNVIDVNVNGTWRMLDFAAEKQVSSMIYLSSMEAYGFTTEEEWLDESNIKYLNPLLIRSCYPESKRMAENLCVSYAAEKGVPVKIIRLGQTFGYGVEANDTRVFAEFARCANQRKNIELLTPGDSTRMYLDTVDAVTAILTVLLKGKNAEAYNAANPETYCSILDMAHMVAKDIAQGRIRVVQGAKNSITGQFTPPHRLKLDTSKIDALGWKPLTGLKEMYKRLMEEMSP